MDKLARSLLSFIVEWNYGVPVVSHLLERNHHALICKVTSAVHDFTLAADMEKKESEI